MRVSSSIGWSLLALSCAAGHGGTARPTRDATSATEASTRLVFRLGPHESLVYRRRGSDLPEDRAPELHWVERRQDGSLVLGVNDDAARAAGRDEMPADLVFPLSDRPVGASPVYASRTTNVAELALAINEEVRVVEARPDGITVRFRRRTAAIDPERPDEPVPLSEQTGEASYDPSRGRFTRIAFTETQDEAQGGATGSTEWVLDEGLSRERTASRAPHGRGSTTPAGDLDAFRAAHDAAGEIAEIVGQLAEPGPSPRALAFQLHAHPAELWAAVLDHPETGPRFAQEPAVIDDLLAGTSDEVVAVLRSRWQAAGFARALVARTADERLRPELRRLASEGGAVGTDARLTLQALDLAAQPRVERWRPLASYPARLQAIWSRLASNRSWDPSPLVPVFLGLASAPGIPAAVGEVCLSVLHEAGYPDAVDDRRVWRSWWSTEGARPLVERLAAAAQAPSPEARRTALARLAGAPDEAPAREALAAGLQNEAPELRLLAAGGLARRRDPRAASVLVSALAQPSGVADALQALGYLGDTTLGMDPAAAPDQPANRAALARWRQWLGRSAR